MVEDQHFSDDTTIAIRLEKISKVYNSTVALANASFEVKKGEIFGLLGHNGAGKTTTIRILKGMIKPTSGEAFIFGKRISENLNWVKQNTGYLPEEGSLIGRLTPLELCEFIGGLYGVDRSNSRTRGIEFFKLFGLYEKKDELIEKLSRGMKQKLSLICSILHDPEIILMDEPLASLDPAAAKMVKDFIKYLSREKRKTIIISSHRLALVEDACNRVAIIHKGLIMDIGTPKEIMSKTNASLLEDAYLSIIPGYDNPMFSHNGTIIATPQEDAKIKPENEQVQGSQ